MDLNKLCEVVMNGELAITPTDTVYGILGDATNEDTIKKVFEAKKRSLKKSLIVLVSDIEMLKRYVKEIDDIEYKLMKEFWPGKMTLILKKNDKLSDLLTGGLSTVAIRIPDNKELLDLVKMVDRPLISTSANISDNVTITDISLLDEELKKHISYIYDGGEIKALSSTLVKVENGKINILREGDLANSIKERFFEYIE